MNLLTRVSRTAIVATLAFAAVSACGGSSFHTQGDGTTGGTASSSGGSASGGASSTKGGSTSGSGGSAASGGSVWSDGGAYTAGGTYSTGGGFSTGGDGSGGSVVNNWPALCFQPADPGNCDGYIHRYHHNPNTGVCEPFIYGGCDGNENNFATLAECQKVCFGGAPNLDACTQNTDCEISELGCCGGCDNADPATFTAYNKNYQQTVQPVCDVLCGACPVSPEEQQTTKYLVPACVRGECTVLDIRQEAATACKVNDDCRLRDGTSCCEDCDGHGIVAVSNNGALETLVCGGILPPCAACEPTSSIYVPICDQGHCQMVVPED